MIIKFCNDCNNLLYLYTDDNEDIYFACKTCGNIKQYDLNKSTIIKNDKIPISNIINVNKNITNDITLPQITNNINLKCINNKCESVVNKLDPKITYMKYDIDELKYIYICQYCGQKWNN
tara:strand:+ start:65 stop:424 length:360 start_codon:yes stop_codon:yes gene_type:complete